MTGNVTVEAAAERLRQAVTEGAYGRAADLLVEYRRHLEEAAHGLSSGGPDSAALAREARELLEWARHMVLASRAAAVTRLKRLPRPVRAYRSAPARPRHTWELTG